MPLLLTFPVSTTVIEPPPPVTSNFDFTLSMPGATTVTRSGVATHLTTAGFVTSDSANTGRIDCETLLDTGTGSSSTLITANSASGLAAGLGFVASFTLDAALATGGAGALSAQGSKSLLLVGVGAAGAVGILSPVARTLAGVAATGSAGVASTSALSTTFLAGNAATGSAGTATSASSTSRILAGTAATGAVGLLPSTSAPVSLSGTIGAGAVGAFDLVNELPVLASTALQGFSGTLRASAIRTPGVSAAGLTSTLGHTNSKALVGNRATGAAGLIGNVQPFGVTVPGAVLTFRQEFNTSPVSVAQQGSASPFVWTDHLWYVLDYHNDRNHYPSGDLSVDLNTVFPIVGSDLQFTAKILPADGQWVGSTMASVNSQGVGFSQTFGFFEARIKMPKGQGMWPAWWLYTLAKVTNNAAPAAELDIMEFQGSEPNIYYTTYHSYATGVHVQNGGSNVQNVGFDLTLDYHVFAMLWDTNHVTWYLDGVQRLQLQTLADQKTPQFMIINLAVGGWKGPPDGTTINPSHQLVDYIRVWSVP